MTHSAKPIQLRFVFGSAAVLVSILMLTFSAAAQGKSAHKSRRSSAAKTPAPVPVRAVNAEEMQALLRRDGKRPLLVNYWATWCDPCRDEFPDLVKIDRDYRAKGLDFIAITLDDLSDINTAVSRFLLTMNAKMPVYLLNVADPEPAINMVDSNWSGALPATFLYDSSGKVVYKHFGRVNPGELRAAIEKLVGTKQ